MAGFAVETGVTAEGALDTGEDSSRATTSEGASFFRGGAGFTSVSFTLPSVTGAAKTSSEDSESGFFACFALAAAGFFGRLNLSASASCVFLMVSLRFLANA